MEKKHFLDRLSLFAGGCATIQAVHYPQPTPPLQPTPVAVVPRVELLVIGVIILAITSFIILIFKDSKTKGKKRKK